MNKALFFIAAVVLLCSCDAGFEEKTRSQLQELISSYELGTTEYTVVKVVRANDSKFWTIGDRCVLFSTTSYLKAGLDMSKYDASKTVIDANRKAITVVLPHAKLLNLNMPAEKIKLAYQKVGILRSDFTSKERNELLKQGEANIRENIDKLGILEEAERNAASLFKTTLEGLGYETVNIKFE